MRVVAVIFLIIASVSVNGFTISSPPRRNIICQDQQVESHLRVQTCLFSSNDQGPPTLSQSEQQGLGIAGTLSASIVFISEYTLASTGCGVPAGPFGLYGLAEGISYLGVVGIAGYSAFTKIKTGSGLPAGPVGLLGAAEGLSYLAILVGLVVLALQVINYGYIPNAVPSPNGICA